MRDMGGKEKKVLVIANVPNYQGSDKKTLCNESVSGMKNEKLPSSAVPPPIPMSPIVEKMEGLKAIRNRSNSLRLGRLAFYRHLEKVETMRCFWELKHVELEGGNQQANNDKDKAKLTPKGLKAQKKRKPLDTSDTSSLNEPVLQEQVEKLNRQNTEHSHGKAEADNERGEEWGSGGRRQKPAELILDGPHASAAQSEERKKATTEKEEEEDVFEHSESEEGEEKGEDVSPEQAVKVQDDGKKKRIGEAEESSKSEKASIVIADVCKTSVLPQESSEEVGDVATCSKRRVTEEDLLKDDLKKSRVEDSKAEHADEQVVEGGEPQASKSDEGKTEVEEEGKEGESDVKKFIIDSSPPPLAPFDHRIVTPKPHQIANYYTINRDEVLGGGRFGQVHKCMENSSGLMLAAKIIKARSQKEKEVVRNEIQVMNQLNHANLIQLYAAFESRHDIILVMEYVEGGELFDRIIDENYNLTELDTVLFIRQICEGLQYMHKMYILHLDLKPENILCVSRATNKIKIIDFGLARRYKPREKLRVNFGTPEFLAPEVINYEFVSFPTDMWSLGVITYMLLSGLSPFLGDDDNETLNNILACQWNFEEEEFTDISDEAKDFITLLLVKSKSWRMSAAESLRHPWLSDQSLHYRLNQKRNKCHSTHAPSQESQKETL
ncbi:myosin light chain kinase 2, skeletal/cardiac muscle isoform X2 [Micropterus dolomieu]|uniref:myosin light chain kinase 2, skeletal/cardiac muscle isoform X2 n=2 Tax=Micropterus dolomieu TaxID=147949 RepID=UPI001E8CCB1E|nr:myosin light chain kinase 2, skeletal/cardiac muscle isoform X2 [Micropterus dolomieu]XP_045905546.1 myosin light chain kinase 2, skeletal/cardiac muscle isoform X2 [Micropterus dolomieu]XP_045905547.1 myosin light chain kinase 2, skeletal/cardiac muscle isoform X2 [Micropterus dolomieu]XP_045905548.1 myosin light chain kinase 2, skeletal/cardiac muscle isoform X2 [Micropterus dolomieu]